MCVSHLPWGLRSSELVGPYRRLSRRYGEPKERHRSSPISPRNFMIRILFFPIVSILPILQRLSDERSRIPKVSGLEKFVPGPGPGHEFFESTYFWDPGSFVAQALQNGQNGYNGEKKYSYHEISGAYRTRTMPLFRFSVPTTESSVRANQLRAP